MMVTSAQHVDCYEARVGKGDAPWRRSFRPADRGSRDCLPGCADRPYRWYEVEGASF